MTHRYARPSIPFAVSVLAVCGIGSAFAVEPAHTAAQGFSGGDNFLTRICARQFEIAQRTDMESFRDYDAETFRAVHDDRAITVFDSGATRIGIDAIMTALASHFSGREAKWTWTERYRVVDGCSSAYILYETVYEIPRIGYRQKALTGVTYSHNGLRWLAIADQGTKLP